MTRLLALALLPYLAAAQSSCGPAPSGSIRPSVASGYRYQVVATGLSRPRGLAFDAAGNLLVVESGKGVVSSHVLQDTNGCVTVKSSSNATEASDLNHGIAVSEDGKSLYASNSNETYVWEYDSRARTTKNRRTLVTNTTGTDHSTRTLLLSRKAPGMLIVGFGSLSNLDATAITLDTGTASVKAFNLTNQTSVYSYQKDGLLLGWGLRNDVGIAEHPNSGGIYSVENSADQLIRDGVDISKTNPAEELNFLGYLNGTQSPNQGTNFGYPWCFSAWNTSTLPNNQNIKVGDQFAISGNTALSNRNQTDAFCADRTKARLVFAAHYAPLDIKFNNSGTEAWITFHGSWNSPTPVGYKLSLVNFTSAGEPVDQLTSNTAAKDILTNADLTACPGNCFRPATIAIDSRGRIFMSSDSSGEIYLVTRDATSNGATTTTPSGAGGTPQPTGLASNSVSTSWFVAIACGLFAVLLS